MKKAFIILSTAMMLSGSLAFGAEHSAMSNVFTLDTQGTGQPTAPQHSALSNTFTLDTRDSVEPSGAEHSAVSNGFILDTQNVNADVNNDGIIGVSDIVLITEAFGTSGEGLQADVNNDGVVNILDIVAVAVRMVNK